MNKIDRLDLEILTAYVLQKDRSYLITYPEPTLTQPQRERLNELVKKRAQGVPIAYLTGKREFWSMAFKVTPEVLIPRHETELLVEIALMVLPPEKILLLELGTGSGAISVALAKERPCWEMVATDISHNALNIAKENAVYHQVNNIQFLQSEWFAQISTRFDAIISNPPYIAEDDSHLAEGDCRFEPRLALVSGKDGLDAIKLIISMASRFLRKNGWVFIEHGYNQAKQVQEIFHRYGFENITTHRDISDFERVTCAKVAR